MEPDLICRKSQNGDETVTPGVDTKLDTQEQSDRGDIIKETEGESPEDIAIQVIQIEQ